jgi:hypothetical protein
VTRASAASSASTATRTGLSAVVLIFAPSPSPDGLIVHSARLRVRGLAWRLIAEAEQRRRRTGTWPSPPPPRHRRASARTSGSSTRCTSAIRPTPVSVDQAWGEFFRDRSGNGSAAPAPADGAVQTATKPTAGASTADHDKPAGRAGPEETSQRQPGRPRQARRPHRPRSRHTAGQRRKARRGAAVSPSSGLTRRPRSRASQRLGRRPDEEPGEQATRRVEPLRGAAARTVTNMDASLSVPTATSVRSVPVKLLIDTASSSTTTSPGPAAARCRSPTSSATRWSRR